MASIYLYVPQHIKSLQRGKPPERERKRKEVLNPIPPSKILPPPWVIPLIDREEQPSDKERPMLEIVYPPSEPYDIVWPPQEQENDKKKDEAERGVLIIELRKKKENQGTSRAECLE